MLKSNGTTQLAISQNGGTTNETITRTYTAGTYYLRVYGYNGATSATVCYTLKVQLGTASKGVEEQFVNNDFSVSPNPAANTANLTFKSIAKGTVDITVTNSVGNIVLQNKATVVEGDNRKQLDVSKLPAGMYFIKIQNGDKTQVAKIMVMR